MEADETLYDVWLKEHDLPVRNMTPVRSVATEKHEQTLRRNLPIGFDVDNTTRPATSLWRLEARQGKIVLMLCEVPMYTIESRISPATPNSDDDVCQFIPQNTPYGVLMLATQTDYDGTENLEQLQKEIIIVLCDPVESDDEELDGDSFIPEFSRNFARVFAPVMDKSGEGTLLTESFWSDDSGASHSLEAEIIKDYIKQFAFAPEGVNIHEFLDNLISGGDLVYPIVTELPWRNMSYLEVYMGVVEQVTGKLRIPRNSGNEVFIKPQHPTINEREVRYAQGVFDAITLAGDPYTTLDGPIINTTQPNEAGYSTTRFGQLSAHIYAYAPPTVDHLFLVHKVGQAYIEAALLVMAFNSLERDDNDGLQTHADAHLAYLPSNFNFYCDNEHLYDGMGIRLAQGIMMTNRVPRDMVNIYHVMVKVAMITPSLLPGTPASVLLQIQNIADEVGRILLPQIYPGLDLEVETEELDEQIESGEVIKFPILSSNMSLSKKISDACDIVLDILGGRTDEFEDIDMGRPDAQVLINYLKSKRNEFFMIHRDILAIQHPMGHMSEYWVDVTEMNQIGRLNSSSYSLLALSMLKWNLWKFANGSQTTGYDTVEGAMQLQRRLLK